jgi:hypothetical protein
LRPTTLLLVWQNSEHVLEACVQLAEALLRAWPMPAQALHDRELLARKGLYSEVAQTQAVRLFTELAATLGLNGPSAPAAHTEPQCDVIYNSGSGKEAGHDAPVHVGPQAIQTGSSDG